MRILPAATWLRFDHHCGRVEGTAVFARAAADAEFLADAGAVFVVRVDGVQRALFLAKQTELSFRPADAAGLVDFGKTHERFFDRDLRDGACRADELTILRQFAARFAGYDIGREK